MKNAWETNKNGVGVRMEERLMSFFIRLTIVLSLVTSGGKPYKKLIN